MEHLNTSRCGVCRYFWGSPSLPHKEANNRSAIFAGIAAILLVFDSPYTVVYTAVAGIFVLPSAILSGLKTRSKRTHMDSGDFCVLHCDWSGSNIERLSVLSI